MSVANRPHPFGVYEVGCWPCVLFILLLSGLLLEFPYPETLVIVKTQGRNGVELCQPAR